MLIFLRWDVAALMPTQPASGGAPLVVCPRLFIQYIPTYPTYLETVSFTRKLKSRHALVTKEPLN
jgi:hypothetical protein